MNMFPHTITIYNQTEDEVTFETIVNITVIRGVLVDESQGANIQKSGLTTADAVNVVIPFEADAGDKTFLPEREYELSLKQAKHWTMRPGKDFFIRGEVVVLGKSYERLSQQYDGVYHITAVDTKDFGPAGMRHWQIGGK